MFRIGLLLALIGLPAYASECVDIENDLDRLACYDRESGRTPSVETVEATDSPWIVEIAKSEFTDQTDVYLKVFSTNDVNCGRFGGPEQLFLFVRCKENTTSVFFGASSCHMADHAGHGRVNYRIDDGAAQTLSATASTDSNALGLWSGRKAIPFVKKMVSKDKLILRFTPFSQSPVTARFDISGLEDAVQPLRKACNW